MRAAALTLALGLLAGCKPGTPAPDPLAGLNPGSNWKIVEIAGKRVPDSISVTLSHPEKGLIAGVSGCNRYNARISVHDGRVRVGELAGTRLTCTDDDMAIEEAFRSNIARVDAVTRKDGLLELLEGDKTVLLARKSE